MELEEELNSLSLELWNKNMPEAHMLMDTKDLISEMWISLLIKLTMEKNLIILNT